MSVRRIIVSTPVVGRVVLFAYRVKIGVQYLFGEGVKVMHWLLSSNETTNLTYELTPYNHACLEAFLSDLLSVPVDTVRRYAGELTRNEELRVHILDGVRSSARKRMADDAARYGRRIGWYVIVRALKPRLVMETGVDKGLGACVLSEALRRNAAEGLPGRYVGIDINPEAGYLFRPPYTQCGEIVIGDSVASIKNSELEVDIFISDSDHSAAYERSEYEAVFRRLSPGGVLVGDNARWRSPLLDFSEINGRTFGLFCEQSLKHWYAGDGLGISICRPVVSFQTAAPGTTG